MERNAINTPTVSVVTIAYNDLDGLRRTRASVEAQSGRWTHVIVDGGSTDGTRSYLDGLRDERTFVRSQPDEGRYDAMNFGASVGSSDLISFMHSGDVFAHPGCLARAASSYAETRWRWAYGMSRLVTSDGKEIGVAGQPPYSFARFALGRSIIPHQAAFFERRFFNHVGPYDLRFGLAADQEHFLRAALLVPPHLLGDFICDFNVEGAGSTRRAIDHFRDMTRARQKVGVKVSPSTTLDSGLSLAWGAATTVKRAVRRLLERGRR